MVSGCERFLEGGSHVQKDLDGVVSNCVSCGGTAHNYDVNGRRNDERDGRDDVSYVNHRNHRRGTRRGSFSLASHRIDQARKVVGLRGRMISIIQSLAVDPTATTYLCDEPEAS